MDAAILLALSGMVFGGLVDFFLKKGVNAGIDANLLFFYSFLVAAVPFGVLCYIESVSLALKRPLLDYILFIGVLFFLASLFLILALKIGEASIVVPIGRMGFVVTAVCAFIFLSETLTIQKGVGILFAIAAIFLLAKE